MTTSGFGVFGTKVRTRILQAIYLLEESHAPELASLLGIGTTTARNAIDTLEQANMVSGRMEGNTRRVRLNPRFQAYTELTNLLERMSDGDNELLDRLATLRRRPRRAGKSI